MSLSVITLSCYNENLWRINEKMVKYGTLRIGKIVAVQRECLAQVHVLICSFHPTPLLTCKVSQITCNCFCYRWLISLWVIYFLAHLFPLLMWIRRPLQTHARKVLSTKWKIMLLLSCLYILIVIIDVIFLYILYKTKFCWAVQRHCEKVEHIIDRHTMVFSEGGCCMRYFCYIQEMHYKSWQSWK